MISRVGWEGADVLKVKNRAKNLQTQSWEPTFSRDRSTPSQAFGYICRQQHAPIQNSCNCVCWHLTWTSWLCLLDTDGASWMHLHMFLIEVSSLEWEWGELTGIGIRCYPLSNTAKALGLAHTCRPVGTTAKEIVFFAYFIKTWEDFLLFGGKKKGNYLRFWKVLKDVFFLFFVGVCIFTSCWTMFTGSLLILFPRRILSRSVGLF